MKNNIQAFPKPLSINPHNHEIQWEQDGMTLHQWYAGLAMQGIIQSKWFGMDYGYQKKIATSAKTIADAMLEEETP